MKRLFLISVLVFLLFTGSIFATPLVDILIPDKATWEQVRGAGFDITQLKDDRVEVVAWPNDLQRIQSMGLTYEVIQENVEEFYRSRLDHELDDMGGYATFDEIGEWALEFVETYSTIATGPDTIGFTLENRPIWVIKISDNPEDDEDEPELFLNAAIHAREVITPMVLMHFAELLAENYETDDRVTDIINENELWILPCFNVDGYVWNEETDPNGGGMWRKNRRRINGVVYGVDLNRNFPYMWGYDDDGSSPIPADQTYRGQSAGSEPAVQVVMEFVNSRNFVSVINYHSYSNLILYPFGYSMDELPQDYDIYVAFTEHLNETLSWGTGRPLEGIGYSTNGDANDWMEAGADYHIFTFVFEVGGNSDGFWPAQHRIEPLVEQQEEPLLRFCETGGHPEILRAPLAPTALVDDTVSGEFTLRWRVDRDQGVNAPVSYDIVELESPVCEDDAETDAGQWIRQGWNRVVGQYHSSNHSYFSGSVNSSFHTMTSVYAYEVQEGDELHFWTMYDIEDDFDYAYVQVSTDGSAFTNLEGNITTNYNPNGANQGNGITGSSSGWDEAIFSLEEYEGESILIRFAYATDSYVLGDGMYIDDITPSLFFESRLEVATAHADTFITIDRTIEQDEWHLWYQVRAIDAQEDISPWSNAAGTIVVPVDYAPEDALPQEFSVSSIYPNPFNPTCSMSINLPETAELHVEVFDMLGRSVAVVVNSQRLAGQRFITLDGTQWSSGLYFVRVNARGESGTVYESIRKAVMMK